MAALEAAGLAPRRIVGVSAGALAGGLWAAGLRAQELERRLVDLRREEFWDPGLPLGGILKGERFAALLREIVPAGAARIEQAPTPFAAVVYDLRARRTVALASGHLGDAVRASCAVPLLFRPVIIDGRPMVDGGVTDRFGATGLTESEPAVAHYLPSTSLWDRWLPRHRRHPSSAEVLEARGLPRLGPYRLHEGAIAIARARDATMRWLEEREEEARMHRTSSVI